MFHLQEVKVTLVHLLVLLALWPELSDCLIITSVLAGDKKFKTISFESKFLKPLMFEKELPSTEFRRHRTMRPPKFDIDVNIPIKLPLEDEYAKEEPKKPSESNIFFQTGEIIEPSYTKKSKGYPEKKLNYQRELSYAASNVVKNTNNNQRPDGLASRQSNEDEPNYTSDHQQQQQQEMQQTSDDQQEQQQVLMAQESSAYPQSYQSNGGDYQQEFVPGGFVNLQLSGPTGGPKMTDEDYDREKWAQQLSQTAGAMPYPILNYQQLQNFYGGLGTFTNGLAENRYMPTGLLDKLKSSLGHFTNKFHLG